MSRETHSWLTAPPEADRVAIRTQQRFVCRRAPVLIEGIALRRPELVVRRTRYVGVVVDERVLSRAFHPSQAMGRLQAFMMMRGSLELDDSAVLGPGDTVVLRPVHQALFRLDNAEFVEIEWTSDEELAAPVWLAHKVDPSALFASYDPRSCRNERCLQGRSTRSGALERRWGHIVRSSCKARPANASSASPRPSRANWTSLEPRRTRWFSASRQACHLASSSASTPGSAPPTA